MTKFLLNAFALPLGLQGLVYATWHFRELSLPSCGDGSEGTKRKGRHHADTAGSFDFESAAELEQETIASRRGDHYFALFLTCAPRSSFAT